MHIEQLRLHCLQKPGTTECFPFDEVTLVFKVAGKMFLIIPLDEEKLAFTAKCPPDKAIELREEYECVTPGYHMNRSMWNTIRVDGTVDDKVLLSWVDLSYNEVVIKLSKKDRLTLQGETR
jgi:predicted DNA-binding protein (MmcQ/YjbR family)